MTLTSLVSPYVGVVRTSVEVMRAADEARLPTAGCALADAEAVVGSEVVAHSGGAGVDRSGALAAAIGEAAERYAAAFVPPRLPFATARELGAAAVPPASFALFHERQHARPDFAFHRFGDDTRVRWVPARSLADGEERFVPAQLVYLRRLWAGEPPIAYVTSNGLACGVTPWHALRSALCELIERDAFVIAWYDRLSLPLLDWRKHAELAELDRRYFVPTGLEYAAVDLSVFFGVPAVLGVVRGGDPGTGFLGIGAACAPTIEEAWRKAVGEAFAVHRWVRDMALEHAGEPPLEPHEIASFDDHVRYYAPPGRAERTRFLTAATTTVDTRDVAPLPGADACEHVEELAARLAARNVSAYAVDVTTVDIGAAGLHVVRAIAPELAPLDVHESARYLGGRRLYEAAFDAGLVDRPLALDDLNRDPHPFP